VRDWKGGENLKTKVITTLMIMLFLASIVLVAFPVSAKPQEFTVSFNQARFRWRARFGLFGDWRDNAAPTQNAPTSYVFTLTGKVLHTDLPVEAYRPDTEPLGVSTVYVYDAEAGVWIQKEGTLEWISAQSPYLPITQYSRGYLEFNGAPSSSTFVHGVRCVWAYVYGYDEATVKGTYPYAVWDSTMDAWWIAFAILLFDTGAQSYDTSAPYTNPAFPSPFIEPVPASNYNPMGL
jgi:hypothetical protein